MTGRASKGCVEIEGHGEGEERSVMEERTATLLNIKRMGNFKQSGAIYSAGGVTT